MISGLELPHTYYFLFSTSVEILLQFSVDSEYLATEMAGGSDMSIPSIVRRKYAVQEELAK